MGTQTIEVDLSKPDDALARGLAVAALLVVMTASLAAGPPAGARREAPPAGIEATAVAVGKPAPSFALPAAGGQSFALTEALARGPAVIVFYRGYW